MAIGALHICLICPFSKRSKLFEHRRADSFGQAAFGRVRDVFQLLFQLSRQGDKATGKLQLAVLPNKTPLPLILLKVPPLFKTLATQSVAPCPNPSLTSCYLITPNTYTHFCSSISPQSRPGPVSSHPLLPPVALPGKRLRLAPGHAVEPVNSVLSHQFSQRVQRQPAGHHYRQTAGYPLINDRPVELTGEIGRLFFTHVVQEQELNTLELVVDILFPLMAIIFIPDAVGRPDAPHQAGTFLKPDGTAAIRAAPSVRFWLAVPVVDDMISDANHEVGLADARLGRIQDERPIARGLLQVKSLGVPATVFESLVLVTQLKAVKGAAAQKILRDATLTPPRLSLLGPGCFQPLFSLHSCLSLTLLLAGRTLPGPDWPAVPADGYLGLEDTAACLTLALLNLCRLVRLRFRASRRALSATPVVHAHSFP